MTTGGKMMSPGLLLVRDRGFFHSVAFRRIALTGSALLPCLVALACSVDGTLSMSGGGKGLAQHYGYWVIFATTPTIVLLTARLHATFVAALRKPEHYCIEVADPMRARLQRLINRHTQSLAFRARSVWILGLLMVVMLSWWLVNIVKTVSPVETYHHDVFDSLAHPFGFYTAKVYILLVFTLVYSVAVFEALHVTVSMISILKFLCRHNILRIDLFHADNCGGTSPFGNINLNILAIYGNFFAIIYGMYLTHHQTYLVMTASLAACSVLAVAQSVAAVYYIHRAIAQRKRECIEAVARRLNEQFPSSLQPGGRFPNDLLAFRTHLSGVHTYPYAASALIAVNIIRFAPAVIAVISYFRRDV